MPSVVAVALRAMPWFLRTSPRPQHLREFSRFLRFFFPALPLLRVGYRANNTRSCSWYKRSEFGIRAALFFSAATVSGAFGGLLAVRPLRIGELCPFGADGTEVLT